MKIISIKKYLKEAVALCERITGKNLSLPILSNILISTNKNKLNLGINAKIYDDRGLPLDENYHKEFTLLLDTSYYNIEEVFL